MLALHVDRPETFIRSLRSRRGEQVIPLRALPTVYRTAVEAAAARDGLRITKVRARALPPFFGTAAIYVEAVKA